MFDSMEELAAVCCGGLYDAVLYFGQVPGTRVNKEHLTVGGTLLEVI